MSDQNPGNGLDTFEHIVVLMLENRSFDNLLGYLHMNDNPLPPNSKYDGLQNGNFSNPVPKRAIDADKYTTIETHRATDFNQPYPDPGEEYQHVNTQLFGEIDPDNIGIDQYFMKAPYNLPTDQLPKPSMNGFINDYESNLEATYNKGPNNHDPFLINYDKYSVIMQCFQPDQIPVLSNLATGFAVFDQWHCDVPSQTFCNRAFWHAGTSGGKVINPLDEGGGVENDFTEMESWEKEVWSQPTIFDRMTDKGVTWGIYSPAENIIPATSLVHGEFKNTHWFDTFEMDVELHRLPQYSFLEPLFLFDHNDQHPCQVNHEYRVGTVHLGEELMLRVYNWIRKSDHYRDKTLLIITHDEHGGCVDHVKPSAAVPPVPGMVGQLDFDFKRLGIRVPMVMISSYIQPNTIVNDTFSHSSFIKTVCDKWGLDPLTDRDINAKPFSYSNLFSTQKRNAAWPEINMDADILARIKIMPGTDLEDDPLNGLQKTILNGLLYIEKKRGLESTSRNSIKTNGDMRVLIDKLK